MAFASGAGCAFHVAAALARGDDFLRMDLHACRLVCHRDRRQPFLVYGLLRTADLVADHPPGMVLSTLIAYLAVYVFLLASYVFVLMYMAEHPAKPTPETPQSPRRATPIRGPA